MQWLRTAMAIFAMAFGGVVTADPPTVNYVFPAGGQRGTTVAARIGGCNLHDAPRLIWTGHGVTAPTTLQPANTLWLEGPLIPQPASQQKEDYPRDFAAMLVIDRDAPPSGQAWRLATSQGVTSPWRFVIGDLPEVVEAEIDGETPATPIDLPVTINGRIFPREDVDEWRFIATAGQRISIHVATAEFGSPLAARITVLDDAGRVLGESLPEGKSTPSIRFAVPADGGYRVRIHDASLGGLQDHVYRLTVTTGPVLDAVFPLGGRRGTTTQFELSGAHLPSAAMMVTLPSQGTEQVITLADHSHGFGAVSVQLDELDEVLESAASSSPTTFTVPAVLNGRITRSGEHDRWVFAAIKGAEYEFDLRAARLGSPLDAVLSVQDATGQEFMEVDDTTGLETDPRLRWTAPADGEFSVVV
ncbi:MAG TPA: PPC domain-containing protein, partial [Planctomycetaceae bacterium]|nr:PPC domain-containing protein [Planctomycetaceae bacterium]